MVVTKLTFLTFFCILYMVSQVIIYYSKARLKNEENKIYTIMMVTNLVGLFLQLLSGQFSYKYNNYPTFVSDFVIKSYLVYFIIFGMLMFWYVITITNNKHKNKIINTSFAIILFLSLIIYFLPMKLHLDYTNGIVYSYGPAVSYSFILGGITALLLILTTMINIKKTSKKKLIPMLFYMILATVAIVIQKRNPELMILCYVESFLCFLMFYTIENPDIIMIEELTKAQKLSENTSNEKSNFIHIITGDISNKLDTAEKISNSVLSLNPEEKVKEYMYDLKNLVNVARAKLNQTIDISDMDNKHLRVTNNKYNVKVLFNSIYSIKKSEVNKNIDLRLNISDDIPEELYGDSIKLKQILLSIIDNSIKYTKEGFIEFRVNSIIKNNICRLIIAVEDSGSGINIYKQNEIMSNTGDLTKEEINSLEDMDLNLKTIRKMISIIGGTFTIDSNKYKGTTVNITIDQRIFEGEKSKEEKQIEKYSEEIKNQKRLAVISLNKNDIAAIKNTAKKNGYKVDEFSVTKDLLDLVRNNEKFDVVFIEEYMEKIDARALLNKLKVENFKGKIFVISKNKDIQNKKVLLDLGFAGIVNTPVSKKEVLSKLENI